jgi:hypothetical protein
MIFQVPLLTFMKRLYYKGKYRDIAQIINANLRYNN